MTQGKSLVEDMAILPCPFCGGEAAAQQYRARHWGAGCMNEECQWTLTAEAYAPSRQKAIAAWNTRSATAALSVLKDRLPADDRELVERLRSSAKAFRENSVFTSDGDGVRLGVQADECDQAADRIIAYSASSLESGADPAFAASAVGPVSRPAPSGINPGERAD